MRPKPTQFATALGMLLAAVATGPQAGDQALARTAQDDSLRWGSCPAFMPEGCRIAVLQGDPARPHADIFFRVPGGADVPRHWHNSPERMVLVEGEMRVTYDGQAPVTLQPGTYAYGPAQAPHAATCLSDGPCTLFIAFVDPVDAMAGAPGQ